ncbi:hypothetical protein GINT2_001223 [Glugoides intestinalis]
MAIEELEETFRTKLFQYFPTTYNIDIKTGEQFLTCSFMHFSISIDKNIPCAYQTLISKCITILELSNSHVKRIFELAATKKHDEFKFSCIREQTNNLQAAVVSSKFASLAQDLHSNINTNEATSDMKASSNITNNEIQSNLANKNEIKSEKVSIKVEMTPPNPKKYTLDTKESHKNTSSDTLEKSFDKVYNELSGMQDAKALANKTSKIHNGAVVFDALQGEKDALDDLSWLNPIPEKQTLLQAVISTPSTASLTTNGTNTTISEKLFSIEKLAESITLNLKPQLNENKCQSPLINSSMSLPKIDHDIFNEFPSKRSLDDILEGNILKSTNTEKFSGRNAEDFEINSSIDSIPGLNQIKIQNSASSHVKQDSNDINIVKAAFHRDTSAFKKIVFECKDEYHSYTKAVRMFCLQYGVCFPEFEIVRENDVFRCTATFLRLNFVSSYEYDKYDSKNSACKKILDYVSRNWEKIFDGKPASMYII